ncbi:MAG TPA: hypothetical protein VI583_02325 [Cyclobacteriaceae bacterium]|nr:hypothetical protein [Cyclobacteriaceae bacterium]
MDPAELARIINDPHSQKPVIFSIGPIELIKSSVDIGQVKEKKNLEKFRQQLYNLSRDKNIVIYCGCCPFADCPNIRPAFMLLNEMKFTNHKLLFLPHNLKIDWMNNGFPINE